MADESTPAAPQPPAGVQRPGVPGAGNILDPAVRADLREQLHAAAPHRRNQPPAEMEESAAEPSPASYRSGPYPHGDVDLRFLSANVPAEPIRPQRRRASRRFYFLPEPAVPPAAANVPTVPPPTGPKPG